MESQVRSSVFCPLSHYDGAPAYLTVRFPFSPPFRASLCAAPPSLERSKETHEEAVPYTAVSRVTSILTPIQHLLDPIDS